ncbi:unnamed protein product, partial [Ixodes hexagonus]
SPRHSTRATGAMTPRPLPAALLLAALCGLTGAAKWTDCGSADGRVTGLTITGCEHSDTCVLKKGSDVALTIDFSANVTSPTVQVKAYGVLEHIPIPFQVPQPDACQSGVTCPVQPGGTYVYQGSFPVKEEYPSLSLNIKWELLDAGDRFLVCVLIPVRIA